MKIVIVGKLLLFKKNKTFQDVQLQLLCFGTTALRLVFIPDMSAENILDNTADAQIYKQCEASVVTRPSVGRQKMENDVKVFVNLSQVSAQNGFPKSSSILNFIIKHFSKRKKRD